MNLCLYPSQQEENIYIRKQAQTWQRSGLITNEQLAGIDHLTDVNVTSPTCFVEITEQTGCNVAGLFIDALERTA